MQGVGLASMQGDAKIDAVVDTIVGIDLAGGTFYAGSITRPRAGGEGYGRVWLLIITLKCICGQLDALTAKWFEKGSPVNGCPSRMKVRQGLLES